MSALGADIIVKIPVCAVLYVQKKDQNISCSLSAKAVIYINDFR